MKSLALAVLLLLPVCPQIGHSGIMFPDPLGGWAYVYDGSQDAYGGAGTGAGVAAGRAALDGLWTHDNGSDSWADIGTTDTGDRLGVGVGVAGGVQSLTEADLLSPGGTVSFLRLMDGITAGTTAGDNRRNYFMKDLATLPGFTSTFMDTGITISFRARLTPDAALEGALTAANKGGTVGSDGKGMFGFRQASGDRIVTFSLHTATDDGAPTPAFTSAGLTLNKNVSDSPSGSVGNGSSAAFPQNDLALDPNVWHEFWITVLANDATVGNGTHTASIYLDGSLTPTTFNFTAGNGDDTGNLPVGTTTNYLELGHNFTPLNASFDADFYTVQFGAIAPVPEPSAALLTLTGSILLLRRRRR